MNRLTQLTSKIALSALIATAMLPATAHAGAQTRAERAISEAEGKIDAGERAGAGKHARELQGQARQELMTAEDQLAHHQKDEAIATAHHASQLADQAIERTNDLRAGAEHARRGELRDTANAARQSAADANIRADAAEQSSAAANAQADALRNAQVPVIAPSTTTTVVTSGHL